MARILPGLLHLVQLATIAIAAQERNDRIKGIDSNTNSR